MKGTLLITVESVAQAGDDLLIVPALDAKRYSFGWIDSIRIVAPDNRMLEKPAEFSLPLDSASSSYFLLLPNTKSEDVSTGSEIWIRKSLKQLTRRPKTREA